MNVLKSKFGVKKYHQNLLGEGLEDLLRRATAKTLELPDEIVNAQVVQVINEDAVHSAKEIVTLLRKRLEMDNPHKQFLAVELMRKVLTECQIVAPLQDEILQAVASVMTRPGRNSPAAQRAKAAARDLLRGYGRTGYDAIRQVARDNFAGARPGLAVGQPFGAPGAPGVPGVPNTVEKASLVDEVTRMVEAARGHTELLQDMLVNSSEKGVDAFEKELMHELLSEVRELRTLFNPYLEQLGTLDGPEVEKAMCDALEAVDMLDNAIALQQDVAVELSQQPASPPRSGTPIPSTASPKAALPAAPGPSSSAAASKPAQPAQRDLIDLSDLGEALPPVATTTPVTIQPPSKDPFAASPPAAASPVVTTFTTNTPSALSSPVAHATSPVAQATSSPVANPLGPPPIRQHQPTNFTPYNPAMQPNNPMFSQQQPYPMQGPMLAIPTGGMMNSPSSPTYPPQMAPYPAGPHMMQPHPAQMYPMMPMQVPPQPMSMFGGMPMAPPQMSYPPPGQHMGFQDNAFPQQGGFAANAFQQPHIPQQPQQQFQAVHNSNNPFAAMTSPQSPPQPGAPVQTNVDKEWDMLFTDKGVPQAAATTKY